MTRSRKVVFRIVVAACMVALTAPIAGARDHGFKAVVRQVETTYHAKRNYRFLMWMVGVASKFARPEGVKSFKIAIFEDQDFSPRAEDSQFEEALNNEVGEKWHPFVSVSSKHHGERTHIYSRDSGDDVHLLIVTIENREAVVMEAKMSAGKFTEMMNDPADISASLRDDSGGKTGQAEAKEQGDAPPALVHREAATPEGE